VSSACLENRRVSAEERRKRFPGDVGDRRVGRDDEAGDAERLAHDHRALVRHRAGRRLAVEAPPLAGDEEAHLDRGVGLSERVLARLARLASDQIGDRAAMLLHQDRETAQDVPALDDRRRRPRRLRLLRALDGRLHVGSARACHAAALVAIRRVLLRERTVVGSGTVMSAHLVQHDCRDREIDAHVVITTARPRRFA
jgi:hypothetical protein